MQRAPGPVNLSSSYPPVYATPMGRCAQDPSSAPPRTTAFLLQDMGADMGCRGPQCVAQEWH